MCCLVYGVDCLMLVVWLFLQVGVCCLLLRVVRCAVVVVVRSVLIVICRLMAVAGCLSFAATCLVFVAC